MHGGTLLHEELDLGLIAEHLRHILPFLPCPKACNSIRLWSGVAAVAQSPLSRNASVGGRAHQARQSKVRSQSWASQTLWTGGARSRPFPSANSWSHLHVKAVRKPHGGRLPRLELSKRCASWISTRNNTSPQSPPRTKACAKEEQGATHLDHLQPDGRRASHWIQRLCDRTWTSGSQLLVGRQQRCRAHTGTVTRRRRCTWRNSRHHCGVVGVRENAGNHVLGSIL